MAEKEMEEFFNKLVKSGKLQCNWANEEKKEEKEALIEDKSNPIENKKNNKKIFSIFKKKKKSKSNVKISLVLEEQKLKLEDDALFELIEVLAKNNVYVKVEMEFNKNVD